MVVENVVLMDVEVVEVVIATVIIGIVVLIVVTVLIGLWSYLDVSLISLPTFLTHWSHSLPFFRFFGRIREESCIGVLFSGSPYFMYVHSWLLSIAHSTALPGYPWNNETRLENCIACCCIGPAAPT